MSRLEAARLSWRDGQPFATDYGDIYHSSDGMAEVARVFLQPAGFEQLLDSPSPLLIGELGFGTGLNFAVVASACIAAGKRLHFVSFDCAPVAQSDFQILTRQRQQALPIYSELAAVYPPLIPGWHRRVLADGLITLSTFWGNADEGTRQLCAEQRRPFSLWLLDGFAPDRNPDMWTQQLLSRLARLSHQGTAVTTFTAAGRVRRALSEAGFEMRRVDQRPHKRESLAGVLQVSGLQPCAPPRQVTVVGAGIAGASVARTLADNGVPVRVIDAVGPAAGASAIPTTVMHGRLLADQQPAGLLRAHAYLYASAWCRRFESDGAVRRCSALQVPSANYPLPRLEQVADCFAASGSWLTMLDAAGASAAAGLAIATPVLQFADAGIIDTPRLCQALLRHPEIELIVGNRLLEWPDTTTVLACGSACQAFPGAQYLELAGVGGQVDCYTASSPALNQLPLALVGNGYLAAGPHGLIAGATYEYQPWPQGQASATNQRYLEQFAGDLATQAVWQTSYRGERCVTSDRSAVAGPLYDKNGDQLPARYVSSGHGSMGTVSAHFSAALIAADIVGDFAPMTPPLRELLSPLRFRLRQQKRGYKFGASN